jgi:death-on-curing family protein
MKYIGKDDGIIIYQNKGKKIEVFLKKETIWLDAHKIAYLFDVDRTVIVKHIKNIYKSGELEKDSTCVKIAQVAADGKKRKMNLYNLNVIISVGYRVNSKRATQFRIWATNVLKTYLIQGYAVDENKITREKLKELENTVRFIKTAIHTPSLTAAEVKGILAIIENYTNTWKWIEEYDSGKISVIATKKEYKKITYKEAKEAITKLKDFLIRKGEAAEIFGVEIDEGLFKSALETIYQTFDGKELYPFFEEKSANLLYLIIKNHPFVDGNKRIGALLFLMFLYENLGFEKLIKRFGNNALTALCYLIAGSEPDQKNILINLITQMINNKEW